MKKITLIPDSEGRVQLPEGFAYTPGQPLTLYTKASETEPSYFPMVLETNEACRFTDEHFQALCDVNDTYKFSRSAEHQLIIEMGTGLDTGRYNQRLATYFGIWNLEYELGEFFDSSMRFRLPDGAIYGSDASFLGFVRWDALPPEARQTLKIPVVPDFVVKIRSISDSFKAVKRKIQEVWLKNGVKEAVLIAPQRKVYLLFTPENLEPEEISFDIPFTCETLPHFELSLHKIIK